MQTPNRPALRTAYDRYGPGTDRRDLGAGYTAAIAAVLASALYVASVWLVDSSLLGLEQAPFFATLEFHWVVFAATRGLLVAVPAAFLVGIVGWRTVSPRTALGGILTGGIGAIATYIVAFVPLVAVLFAAEGGSPVGAALVNAFEIAGLSVGAGFALTGWLTIPIGCLVGLAYAVARGRTD